MGLLQSSQSVVLLVILLLLVAVNIAIFVSTQQRGGARREWDSRVVEERGYGRWSPADTRVRRPRQYSVGLQNAIVPSGYSLTGRPGPSVSSLQENLKRCSRAMGISEATLRNSRANLTTLATDLFLYLSALRSIVPQNFSQHHSNPCWYSSLRLPLRSRHDLRLALNTETSEVPNQQARDRFYQQILAPAINGTAKTFLCLPAFFLAGFSKSGTTTLHSALSHHSMIAAPPVKEPHWWTRMPLDNMEQNYLRLADIRYLLYFSTAVSSIEAKPQLITYDGSQSTLWDSNFFMNRQDYCAMPTAVSHVLPKAKFVVVMRNPITRTFSHYLYSCSIRYGNNLARWPPTLRSDQAGHFHREVAKEVELFTQCLSNSSAFECTNEQRFRGLSKHQCGEVGYRLAISLYYVHLYKWRQFFPREQFLFLRMEDMSREPQAFMKRVTDFLDLAPMSPAVARRLLSHRENVQSFRKRRSVDMKMLPETRTLLSEFFRPFNQKLMEMTGDSRFLWDSPSH